MEIPGAAEIPENLNPEKENLKDPGLFPLISSFTVANKISLTSAGLPAAKNPIKTVRQLLVIFQGIKNIVPHVISPNLTIFGVCLSCVLSLCIVIYCFYCVLEPIQGFLTGTPSHGEKHQTARII